MVKRTALIMTFVLIVVVVGFGFNNIIADKVETAENGIVAKVNDEELTLDQLDQYIGVEQLMTNISSMAAEFSELIQSTEAGEQLLDEYRKIKLDDMISQELVKQEAENSNISDEEKDDFFNEYIASIKEQNSMSDEEILTTLQEQGFESLDSYKEYIFNNGVKISILQEKVLAEVNVEDAEIEEYYNNNQEYFQGEEEGQITPLEEVKTDIEEYILAVKQQEKWEEFIVQLNENADIEKYI
ncbi:MAG: hypothetical protein FH762_18400 [Firmicutes bacterium]|nr:hypothetical protein [Bacillota bacterium]